jgi:hypothetical protein
MVDLSILPMALFYNSWFNFLCNWKWKKKNGKVRYYKSKICSEYLTRVSMAASRLRPDACQFFFSFWKTQLLRIPKIILKSTKAYNMKRYLEIIIFSEIFVTHESFGSLPMSQDVTNLKTKFWTPTNI